MKEILVVYHWTQRYKAGYGHVNASVEYDVPNIENIREIERQICERFNFDSAVVLNVLELKKESEDTE